MLAQSGELIKVPDIGEVAYYGAIYGSLTVAQPGYLVEIYMRPDLRVAPEEMDAETHIRRLAAVYESVEW